MDASFHVFKIPTRDEVSDQFRSPTALLPREDSVITHRLRPKDSLIRMEKRGISFYVLNRIPIPQSSSPNPSHYTSLSTAHQPDKLMLINPRMKLFLTQAHTNITVTNFYVWLTVHPNKKIVFFITNLMHKFFILIHLLYSSTCFEHY